VPAGHHDFIVRRQIQLFIVIYQAQANSIKPALPAQNVLANARVGEKIDHENVLDAEDAPSVNSWPNASKRLFAVENSGLDLQPSAFACARANRQ
jgi:hypothetical protein